MRKITQEEVNKIIRKHELWLTGNSEGERAVLCDVDMSGKTLIDANLRYANLTGADLENANLTDAILRYANLTGADLENANLTGAILSYANLTGANLRGANLTDANLRGANLRYAILSYATDLSVPMACPTHGAFIAWKKCFSEDAAYIVKLQIPASAKRLSGTSRKCRTDKAKVLEIQTLQGKKLDIQYVHSSHYPDFQYRVGETVRPTEPFCEDRWRECSSGIHFFIDREEAVRY